MQLVPAVELRIVEVLVAELLVAELLVAELLAVEVEVAADRPLNVSSYAFVPMALEPDQC